MGVLILLVVSNMMWYWIGKNAGEERLEREDCPHEEHQGKDE